MRGKKRVEVEEEGGGTQRKRMEGGWRQPRLSTPQKNNLTKDVNAAPSEVRLLTDGADGAAGPISHLRVERLPGGRQSCYFISSQQPILPQYHRLMTEAECSDLIGWLPVHSALLVLDRGRGMEEQHPPFPRFPHCIFTPYRAEMISRVFLWHVLSSSSECLCGVRQKIFLHVWRFHIRRRCWRSGGNEDHLLRARIWTALKLQQSKVKQVKHE